MPPAPPAPRPPLARQLRTALLATAGLVLAIEGALQLSGFAFRRDEPPILIWNPHEDRQMDEGKSLFVRDPEQLWVPRPLAEIEWASGERINAAGYRGPLVDERKPAGTARVATLGDSSTFGLFVPYSDCYSGQLQARLAAGGRAAEVIDAGVVGYTVRQGVERYRALVRRFRPDVVVAAFGAVNEHYLALGGLPDRQKIARSKRAAGLSGGQGGGLRAHLRLPQLVDYLRFELRGGRVGVRQAEGALKQREAELMKDAGTLDWEGDRRVSPEDFERALLELRREVEADGARLVLVSMPRQPVAEEQRPVLVRYTEVLEQLARREGLQLVDARRMFLDEIAAGAAPNELYAGDWWHPNARGHGRIAEGLAALVLDPARERYDGR